MRWCDQIAEAALTARKTVSLGRGLVLAALLGLACSAQPMTETAPRPPWRSALSSEDLVALVLPVSEKVVLADPLTLKAEIVADLGSTHVRAAVDTAWAGGSGGRP